jgi:hypothetical protein
MSAADERNKRLFGKLLARLQAKREPLIVSSPSPSFESLPELHEQGTLSSADALNCWEQLAQQIVAGEEGEALQVGIAPCPWPAVCRCRAERFVDMPLGIIFADDLGVVDLATGSRFLAVTGNPEPQQYQRVGSRYYFNEQDVLEQREVLITYSYFRPSAPAYQPFTPDRITWNEISRIEVNSVTTEKPAPPKARFVKPGARKFRIKF